MAVECFECDWLGFTMASATLTTTTSGHQVKQKPHRSSGRFPRFSLLFPQLSCICRLVIR
jgi:hypothetical protein